MKQVTKLFELTKAPVFNITTLKTLYDGENLQSLYSNLKRWLKRKTLIKLKKGIYTTSDYFKALSQSEKDLYLEYIANCLMPESYLSMEYMLQKYTMLSESVFAYTSVTLKRTQTYENELGKYIYLTIKENLFTGFSIQTTSGFSIATATKAKALFDYLYFRLYRVKNVSRELIQTYRLNLDDFTEADFQEFKSYCIKEGSKKFLLVPKLLNEVKNDY